MIRSLGLALVAITIAPALTTAQTTWYLQVDMTSGNEGNDNWNSKVSTSWNSSPDGSGTTHTALNSTDIYDNNGHQIRSTQSLTYPTSTFAGGTLRLNGGRFSMKALTSRITGTLQVTSAGTLIASNYYTPSGGTTSNSQTLEVTNFVADGVTELRSGASAASYRQIVKLTNLTGTADLRFVNTANANGNNVLFSATNATGYTGNIVLANYSGATSSNSLLEFDNDLASGGGLVIEANSKLTLSHSLSFTSLSIGGTNVDLTKGIAYDYDALVALNASFANYLADGGGTLTIANAIPEPSAVAALFGLAVFALAAIRRRRP